MEEPIFLEYLMILRRWRKLFGVSFALLLVLAVMMTASWSNYRSIATIEIKQQEISADTTVSAGVNPGDLPEALADLRIGQIEQKVFSRQSLIAIITKYNLYAKARETVPIAALAEAMQKKIKLTLISGTVANPAAAGRLSPGQLSAIAFTLSFDYNDPQVTQKVTTELVTRFLDEDMKDRHAKAQETSDFLGKQIALLENAMADQEKQIAEFQKAHGGNTPESLQFFQQTFSTTTQNLQNVDSQIVANEGLQGLLRSQISSVDPYSRVIGDGTVLTTPTMQLRALQTQYTALTSRYGPDHPDVLKARRQIEALQMQAPGSRGAQQLNARIADTQAKLGAKTTAYGVDHPDVVALQRQLSMLENQQALQPSRTQLSRTVNGNADNPAYLELIAQLKSAELQHKALLAQRERLDKERTQYQKIISDNPGLEQQLAGLSRDYENAKLRYRAIKEKKMVADMNQQLQMDSKGQRLAIINPAQLPLNTSPSRLLILLAGCMIALLGSIGSVFAAQTATQYVIGIRSLAHIVGVEPMVAIPHIRTADEATSAQNMRLKMNKAFVIALLITAIMAAYSLLQPLGRP